LSSAPRHPSAGLALGLLADRHYCRRTKKLSGLKSEVVRRETGKE